MKKLLLASIIMIGVSGVAFAQTPEAVRAKKEAAKRDNNKPALTNSAMQTSTAPTANKAVQSKTDADMAKPVEVTKPVEKSKPVKVIEAAKAAEAKKAKDN